MRFSRASQSQAQQKMKPCLTMVVPLLSIGQFEHKACQLYSQTSDVYFLACQLFSCHHRGHMNENWVCITLRCQHVLHVSILFSIKLVILMRLWLCSMLNRTCFDLWLAGFCRLIYAGWCWLCWYWLRSICLPLCFASQTWTVSVLPNPSALNIVQTCSQYYLHVIWQLVWHMCVLAISL